MKRYILILLILKTILTGCSSSKARKDYFPNQSNNSKSFLNGFPEITFKKLHIYSPNEKPQGNKYEGQQIDTSFYSFFEFDNHLKYTLENNYNIFSCYKFKLTDNQTGLIVRTKSQYSETAIDLLIWDNLSNTIVNRIELADAFGSGTWFFVKDAWILDINNNGYLDIVTRKKEWWEEDEDEPNENRADTIKLYLGNGINFKLAEIPIDTSNFQVLDWDLN